MYKKKITLEITLGCATQSVVQSLVLLCKLFVILINNVTVQKLRSVPGVISGFASLYSTLSKNMYTFCNFIPML